MPERAATLSPSETERVRAMTYAPAMGTPTRDARATAGALGHGWVRLVRGAILGGSSLVLATGAHVVGGGSLPGGALLVLTGVALAVVAVSLTVRRLRFAPLFAVLGLEQVLLHVLFHAATTAASCTAIPMPGHAMPATTVCGSGSGGAAATGWAMLLAHALAVAATAWLLACGERWLWRVADRVHAYATIRPGTRRRRRRMVPAPFLGTDVLGATWLAAAPRGPPLASI